MKNIVLPSVNRDSSKLSLSGATAIRQLVVVFYLEFGFQ